MTQEPIHCLVLACGNTLRGDDGVGIWLGTWAEVRFRKDPSVRVIKGQQWTPELAEDLARAGSALFIDCSAASAPGALNLIPVEPSPDSQGFATHHFAAAQLLALSDELYGSRPASAQLFTIGAKSVELEESLSDEVQAVLPDACALLEETVLAILNDPKLPVITRKPAKTKPPAKAGKQPGRASKRKRDRAPDASP
jgi:hydrogenase maturation protease